MPYSLKAKTGSSDRYYAVVAALADRWPIRARHIAGAVVIEFRAFRQEAGLAERTFNEDAFELLVLGVLLREHGAQAARFPAGPARFLARLVALQDRWPWAEGAIKAVRGIINGLVNRVQADPLSTPPPAAPSLLPCLLSWLQAQGQTTQAQRLATWQEYWAGCTPERAQAGVETALRLAEDFARESAANLDQFTTGVDTYRAALADQVRFRYDSALVLRSRLEYHLGMLGTELLNRAYRSRFLATPAKLVIIPPCLRALPETGPAGARCQAVQTPLGAQCQGCRADCRVHQLTRLGQKQGFAVTCIPDDELQKVCLASGQTGGKMGVVGLSCALTNWNAGWEAERLGLPAQGLLLDHPGCDKHWCRPGMATDTNFIKLQALMGQ